MTKVAFYYSEYFRDCFYCLLGIIFIIDLMLLVVGRRAHQYSFFQSIYYYCFSYITGSNRRANNYDSVKYLILNDFNISRVCGMQKDTVKM